jgi:hypothetical protein
MYWLTHPPKLVRLAPRWSIITNPFDYVVFLPLVPFLLQPHHGSNLPSVTQLAYICKCLMDVLSHWPTVVFRSPCLSIINNLSGHAGFLPLVPYVSFTPIMAPSIALNTHVARGCKCLMYWLTHSPTLVILAPCWSIITNPFGHVVLLPLVSCLPHSHCEKKQSINHASSSRLQVFDVLTYSLANCGLTCSSLMNY